jgi:hypothetical protein
VIRYSLQTILLFLILFPAKVFALSDCFENNIGKIKFLDDKKIVVEKIAYCFDSESKLFISPKSSFPTKNPIKLKFSEVHSELGSLGFNICHKVEGIPQFIDYWDGKNWISTSRCMFSDKSFVDIATLATKVEYVD